jgi:curved DNA-binding protein CbpA
MSFKNYYDILGIDSNADTTEIKEAFRVMTARYSSSTNKMDDFSQTMLKNLNEAVEVLANPEKRKAYDDTRVLLDDSMRLSAVHQGIKQQDASRIAETISKHFEQEKQVKAKYDSLLVAKNAPPTKHFTSVKVFLCLIIIGATTFFYHPDKFDFIKGTPEHEQRAYEWYTMDTTLIYAKPKAKAKVIHGVPALTGFNGISETTYYIKITFTDANGKSREGFIKKKELEKNRTLIYPTP